MSKRNSDPRFLPCVATHYRNRAKTVLKNVAEMRTAIVEKYHGHLVPDVIGALEALELQAQEVLVALDSKCSKPEFTAPETSTES